jgi:hypothetical protein
VVVAGGADTSVVAGTEVVTGSTDVGGCDVEAAALGAVVVASSPRPRVALPPKSLVTPPTSLPKSLVTPPRAPPTAPPAPPKRLVSPESCLSLRSTQTILLASETEFSASPPLPSEPAITSPSSGFRRKKLILILKGLKTSNKLKRENQLQEEENRIKVLPEKKS